MTLIVTTELSSDKNPVDATSEIRKRDTLGRVWTPRAKREALLDEFERSGTSAVQFARNHGINYQTLASWVQKRKRERSDDHGTRDAPSPRPPKPTPTLVLIESHPSARGHLRNTATEAAPDLPPRGRALGIELPGGGTLRLCDEREIPLAAELLRYLQASAPAHEPC